ncbi:hypothetical protein, partial [Enterococcus avium]|uniref:hypothetical protein n=1 Tax=Enterococcus avium TaxID=33945 RepID=UPI0032E3E876
NVIDQIGGAESAILKKELLVDGTEGTGSRDDNGTPIPFSDEDYAELLSEVGTVKVETGTVGNRAKFDFSFKVINTLSVRYPYLFKGMNTIFEKISWYKAHVKNVHLIYTGRVGLAGSKAIALYIKNVSNDTFSGITADGASDFITYDKSHAAFKANIDSSGNQTYRLASYYSSDGVTPAWVEIKDVRLVIEIEASANEIIKSEIAANHVEN